MLDIGGVGVPSLANKIATRSLLEAQLSRDTPPRQEELTFTGIAPTSDTNETELDALIAEWTIEPPTATTNWQLGIP